MKKTGNQYSNITLNGIIYQLLHHDNFLLFLHENPDADTIGSNLALANTLKLMGKNAYIVSTDYIPQTLLFLTEKEKDFTIERVPADYKPDYLISCDVASASQLGKYKDFDGKIDLAIDHHQIHDIFTKYRYIDPLSSAAAEIVYKIVTRITPHIPLDRRNACLLYAALAADTGGFRYSNTTPYTHKVAAKLIECGADHTEICRNLFEMKTLSAVKAETFAQSHASFYKDGKISYVKITEKDRLENGFSAGDEYDVINVIRRIDGVKISIFAREREDGLYKISTRSACNINVADLCAKFGGGGHFAAAGCSVQADEVDNAVRTMMEECRFDD